MSEWTVNNKLNEWYEKQYHIKLPKQYVTKALIYFSRSASPLALFAAGEAGVWYDPSDVANLNWRRNLLTYSEQFDNAIWGKSAATVPATQYTAPDGTLTADKFVESASTALHFINQDATVVAGAHAFSAYFKAAERTFAFLYHGASNTGISINLSTGATGVPSGTVAPAASSVTSVGDGWYRLAMAVTATAGAQSFRIYLATSLTGSASYAGDGTSGIYLWGAQLELGSVATDYQRITDVNTEVIERFPTATLYQDTIGTIPVTTPGQAVALMLDKSRGLTLGGELVSNGTFDSATGWTISGSGVSITGGALVCSTNATANIYASISPASSTRTFKVTWTLSGVTAGDVILRLYNNGANVATTGFSYLEASGTYSAYVQTSAAPNQVWITVGGAGLTGSIDNISVRELAGNHATQATAASRPIYGVVPQGGRRNLLLQTEAFETASWSKLGTAATVTADNTTDPLGGNTADRIAFAASGIANRVSQSISPASGAVPITLSIWLRGSVGGEVVQISDGWTNSSPLTLTTSWQRFTSSITGNASTTAFMLFAQTGTPTVFAWGAQLEQSATATPYQRVTTQYDVTEAGVPSCSYLFFDGGSDSMATGSIDFTATDKMTVWAGLRKLSDAAAGIIAELGTSGIVAGTFKIGASTTAGDASRRTWFMGQGNGGVEITAGVGVYPSPDSRVQTGLFDRGGATPQEELQIRLDGTAQTLTYSTTDLTAGNYANLPLYIGARAGTSAFFNGNLFGLVVRGAASTTAQITDTEQWLAPKSTFFKPLITGIPTVGVS